MSKLISKLTSNVAVGLMIIGLIILALTFILTWITSISSAYVFPVVMFVIMFECGRFSKRIRQRKVGGNDGK